eukprot:GHVR01039353.1.p5 GENE.GHVR01039353.1~~GHVR01039353.1.p5  ORF type:complete len:102 (-),score=9.62 GHVR01039353.1:899-1204(-)
MTTHTHQNGTVWSHHHTATDHSGKKLFVWTCQKLDGAMDRYISDEHGWIPIADAPKMNETDVIAYDAKSGARYTAQWLVRWGTRTQNATHWRPEMQLPEIA